jgi:DNA topoisomerase II
VTRKLFPAADDNVLEFLVDEGQSIEPSHYLPIIPLVLVNGADGIGTGWSTAIPMHNPRDIVKNLRLIMKGKEPLPMQPWYKGWTGEMEVNGDKGYTHRGLWEVVDDTTLVITELPVGKWTRDYQVFLDESLLAKEVVKEIDVEHRAERVRWSIEVPELKKKEEKNEIEKTFKLASTLGTTNMVAFSATGQLTRYASATDILKEYFPLRVACYERRKAYQLQKLERDHEILVNKVKFIRLVISDELVLRKVKKAVILKKLVEHGLKSMTELAAILKENPAVIAREQERRQARAAAGEEEAKEDPEDEDQETEIKAVDYDYLLGMALWSLSEERVAALIRDMEEK